jgi:hypothetical protein
VLWPRAHLLIGPNRVVEHLRLRQGSGPVQAQRIAAVLGERTSDGVQGAAHDMARAGRTEARQVDGGRMALERGERVGDEGAANPGCDRKRSFSYTIYAPFSPRHKLCSNCRSWVDRRFQVPRNKAGLPPGDDLVNACFAGSRRIVRRRGCARPKRRLSRAVPQAACLRKRE